MIINDVISGLFAGATQSILAFFLKYIPTQPNHNLHHQLSNINRQLRFNLYQINPIDHKVSNAFFIAARFTIYSSIKSLLHNFFFLKTQTPQTSISLILSGIAGSISSASSLLFNLNSMALDNIKNRYVKDIVSDKGVNVQQMLRIYKWQVLASIFYFFSYELIKKLLTNGQGNGSEWMWALSGGIAGLNHSLITYLVHFNTFCSTHNPFIGPRLTLQSIKVNRLFFIQAIIINSLTFTAYQTTQRYLHFWDNCYYNVR